MSGAPNQSPPSNGQAQKGRGLLPPEIVDFLLPPLYVGGYSGGAGALTGAGAAILSNASPVVSGIMTGSQWAVLGTTYWFSRQVTLRALGGEDKATPFDKVKASAVASLPTGALMGVSASKARSVGPSMALCGVVAIGGQLAVNHFAGRPQQSEDGADNSWMQSKWSPLTKMSDHEYREMMDEKILGFDADIALIDDRIAQLRLKQQESDAETSQESQNPR